ncbi:ADP-ribosyltransferase-containing protein [Helicobacter winghamensis]|uniref:ADP-ribosyltransferase-containing protein n=1 Tax=Helicobacter winghamensis TaxID=157268 RepID=UPI00351AE223
MQAQDTKTQQDLAKMQESLNNLQRYHKSGSLSLLFSNDTEKKKVQEEKLEKIQGFAENLGFDGVGVNNDGDVFAYKGDKALWLNEGFFDNFSDVLLNNSYGIAGSVAGGMLGSTLAGAKAGRALGSVGGASGQIVGGILGSAIGAFGGGILDAVNTQLKNKEEINAKFLENMLRVGNEEMLFDLAGGSVGTYVLANGKKILTAPLKATKKLSENLIATGTLKNLATTQNINAAKDLLDANIPKEVQEDLKAFANAYGGNLKMQEEVLGLTQAKEALSAKYGEDSILTKTASALEKLALENNTQNAQKELLELIRADSSGQALGMLYQVAKESPKANDNLKSLLNKTTQALNKELESLNLNPQTLKEIYKELESGTKESYDIATNKVLLDLYENERITLNRGEYDNLRKQLENNAELETSALSFLKFVENSIFNPQGVGLEQLINARKTLNGFIKDTKDSNTKSYLKNIVENHLHKEINNGINKIFQSNPHFYQQATNLYNNSLSDYATMKETLKDLKKLGFLDEAKSNENLIDKFIKYIQGDGGLNSKNNFIELTKGLSEQNKQAIELNVLNRIYQRNLLKDDGIEVFASKNFLRETQKLKEVFNTKGAREFIELMEGFNKLFSNDAEIALKMGYATPRVEGSSIATTIEGAIQQKMIKGIFGILMRNLPHNSLIIKGLGLSENVQAQALRYHLKKALENTNDIHAFKTHLSQNADKQNFNSATQQILKEILGEVDTLKNEVLRESENYKNAYEKDTQAQVKSDIQPLKMLESGELDEALLKQAQERNLKLWVGNLENEQLAKELGLDSKKPIRITMQGNAITHIEKRHGANSIMAQNGQPSIQIQDYANHAQIVNTADKSKVILSDDNQRMLVSGKQVNGYYIIVESISTKKNELKLKTMYKENGRLEDSAIFKSARALTDHNNGGESLRLNPSNSLDFHAQQNLTTKERIKQARDLGLNPKEAVEFIKGVQNKEILREVDTLKNEVLREGGNYKFASTKEPEAPNLSPKTPQEAQEILESITPAQMPAHLNEQEFLNGFSHIVNKENFLAHLQKAQDSKERIQALNLVEPTRLEPDLVLDTHNVKGEATKDFIKAFQNRNGSKFYVLVTQRDNENFLLTGIPISRKNKIIKRINNAEAIKARDFQGISTLLSHTSPELNANLTTKDRIKQARDLGLNPKEAVEFIKNKNLPQPRTNTLPQNKEILEAEIVESEEIPHLQKKLIEWIEQNATQRPQLIAPNQQARLSTRDLIEFARAQNLPPKQAVYLINNTPRNLPIKVESTQKVNANAQNVNTKNVNEKGNIENNVKDVENVESKDLKTLRAQTKEALKPYTQQKITNKGDNTQAVLTHKGISEMLSAKAIAQSVNNGFTKAQHLQAVQNIKDLFESAVFKESQAPKHPKNDVLAYRIYNAPFENANAVISVQERKVNDDVLYFVKLENLQPMQNEASAFTSNLQGLKSKVDNPAERQTLPSLDSEKIIPQQVKTTQEIIKEAKDKNVILKAQNPTKAQIAYFNPFMNEYEKIKEIKKLHTQDDNLIRVMKVDGRNDYIEPLSNMSVSKEYLQKQTAQSLKEQITQAILGNQTQLKALQQGYNTYHLSTFQKEVLESALDIANNPTKYKEYKLQGLQKQLDNLNSNEAYHIEKSREYDRARYAKDRQELEKEISALKGTESSLESVPQKVESSDIVFTDKKGKQHTLTKEVAQQWLETFNLKSLDETYTPQHTQEIKQALGGKEIRLQLGSLKKLVAQGREQYIPQIKEVLDSPEAIMRDDMGEYLFIKHLKDDDYFVNVSFDNGEYLVSISNGIKETRNLNNKIKKGGSFIYQSPNFNSISQKLLQTSQYSANKIDENILPQSKEKIKQEKSREIKRMLKTLKAAGAYDDTEYITSIFPDFFDYFDKANNFYVPKYYTDFKDFIDQVTQLRPLSLFEHSKFPSVKDFESIILNSKNVDFESLKKIQGLKEIVEMLEKEAEIFNSLPQRPKSLKEYFKIKEARNRKTAFKPVTIEKYVKAHFNEPNASESYKEAAKVGIQNAINRAKTKEYKQNLKKWGEGASHYLRDENGDLLLNADGFYYNDKAFFDKHFFKKMYKKRFPAASLASILEEYKAAKSNYENAINTNDFKRFKHDVYFDFMLKKSALNEGSFNPDSKNVLQSNPHLGSGLVGGSVAGIEQDENGNLSFSPEKFALGLLGGVVGSKAVAKGFAYLKENPQVKEAVARELANTLALGFDKAKAKYPALSLLEPRYIVQNEKGRKIQAKSMLKELEKEQKGLYNVAFNGKNAVLIQKDLENIDEAILLQKGTKRKGGKHIRLAHSTDKTQEGYVTKNEVVNLGKDIRQFLKEHKEPFIDTNGARLYEWEKDSARFRVVVNDIQDSGGNSLLPSASEEIITFYSDRNLKEKMEFKNPVLKVQEKFNFNPQKARDLLEWHKDSSPLTKDENGLPKVFYHGSKEKDFEIFERQEKGKFDIGFWFSDNKAFADKYTIDTLSANKGSLYKVFLNMKNPFSMNAPLNESKKAEIHNIFTPTNANKNKAEAELNKWYLAKDELRKNNLELQEYIPEHIIIRDTKNGELFQIGHEHLLRKNRLEDIEDLSGYADSKEFVNKLKAFDNLVGEAKFDNLIKITQDYPNEYFKNDMEFYITRLIDKTELDNNIKGLYEIKPYISTHYAVLRRQPISSILKQKGYDGIVFANDEFVVFDSNQIKHIENKGQNGTYFNDSSPNIYQSNPHLGSGLVGGSVAGIEEDENGNLSFNAEKFALGLLGGVVGSKAVAKGLEWRANKVAKSYPNIAKDNPTLMSEIAKRDLATYARTNAYNTITRFLNNNKILDVNPQLFAGEKALINEAYAPHKARLEKAKELESKGADEIEIWEKTGWYKDKDKKWKFEISQRGGEFDYQSLKKQSDYYKESLPLAEFLHDEKLYQAYPELMDLKILATYDDGRIYKDVKGQYNGDYIFLNTKHLTTDEKAKSILYHELQHAIQDIEGFAYGYKKPIDFRGGFDKYKKQHGEVEARNVEARLNSYGDIHSKQSLKDEIEKLKNTLLSAKKYDPDTAKILADRIEKYEKNYKNLGEYDIYNTRKHPYKTMDTHINDTIAEATMQGEALSKELESSFLDSNGKIDYKALESFAIPLPKPTDIQTFSQNLLNSKNATPNKAKNRVAYKTPAGVVNIYIPYAYRHFGKQGNKKENRFNITGVLIHILDNPTFVTRDEAGTLYFYKPFKNANNIIDIVSISIAKNGKIEYRTTYEATKGRLKQMITRHDLIYMGHKEVAT